MVRFSKFTPKKEIYKKFEEFLSKLISREIFQTYHISFFFFFFVNIEKPLNFIFLMFLSCISNFVQIGYYLLFD